MAEAQGRVTLWGIEVFLAVAEEGTISAAARRLGVSPPAVSQQLAVIEQSLGAPLFDRTARPFLLTSAGAVFRRHGQVILNAEAEARAELSRSDPNRSVTFRIGVIEDLDAEVTPVLLHSLSKEMSGARFLLETGASHRLIDGLEARALDVAIAAELGTEAAQEGWREVHPLLNDPFVAVHPASARVDGPLILYSSRQLMGRQISSFLARNNLHYPVRFELDSYNAILSLVAQGTGWTILTPLALHHAARFLPDVEVSPLPAGGFSRMISASARGGVMGDFPARVAAELRPLLTNRVVAPALSRWPWLTGQVRVL